MMKQPSSPLCHEDKSSVWLSSIFTETRPLTPLFCQERIWKLQETMNTSVFSPYVCLRDRVIQLLSGAFTLTPNSTFNEANDTCSWHISFFILLSWASTEWHTQCRYSIILSFYDTVWVFNYWYVWQMEFRFKSCALINVCLLFVCIFSILHWLQSQLKEWQQLLEGCVDICVSMSALLRKYSTL